MARKTRSDYDFKIWTDMGIVIWTPTRHSQEIGIGEDTGHLNEIKSDGLFADPKNWPASDANVDGETSIWCVDYSSTQAATQLVGPTGYEGTNISDGLDHRIVQVLGTIKIVPGPSASLMMPGEANEHYLNYRYELHTVMGAAGWFDTTGFHYHGMPTVAESADIFLAGQFYTAGGQADHTGNAVMKILYEPPRDAPGHDRAVWIYLDSDDDTLKIYWDIESEISKGAAWALRLAISPKLEE